MSDIVENDIIKYPTGRPQPVIGHYTQLVWAKTKKVGCGFIATVKGDWFTQVKNNKEQQL